MVEVLGVVDVLERELGGIVGIDAMDGCDEFRGR